MEFLAEIDQSIHLLKTELKTNYPYTIWCLSNSTSQTLGY
jgi:hypothetical protein